MARTVVVFLFADPTNNLRNLRTKLRPLFLGCFALAAAAFLSTARAHVPVPDSVLDPQTAPEAWNVLRLATDNADRLLREDRLAELPNQVSLCSPALRELARVRPDAPAVTTGVVRAAVAVNSAAQSGLVGDRPGATAALAALRATLSEMAPAFDAQTVRADIFTCPMHPEVVTPDPAAPCPKCGMALNSRRIPYSFIYVPPGEPSIRLTATADTPPAVGREARVTIHLSHRDGTPVPLSELEVTHTQPIHLLIVDPAREDYHHEHPVPTGTPGDYAFSFTPARPTGYRIFADLVPLANGVQEYPFTDLPGDGAQTTPPPVPRPASSLTTLDGLRFRLTCDDLGAQPLPARQTHRLRVTVTEAETGQPVQRLEPVMNAFAHLVGFYAEDDKTVVHLHPLGGDILNPNLRGGPVMDFQFYPPRPGHLRLFCQVCVDGRMIFAPFDVEVMPSG